MASLLSSSGVLELPVRLLGVLVHLAGGEERRRHQRAWVKRGGERGVLALIWVLGFFLVRVLGVVGVQSSRPVTFERVAWPFSVELARVLPGTFTEFHTSGGPSDNAPRFRRGALESHLAPNGVRPGNLLGDLLHWRRFGR